MIHRSLWHQLWTIVWPDKIDNIRAEFPLLEANLPCYSFLSMDSIMPICTITLYHLYRVTDPELFLV